MAQDDMTNFALSTGQIIAAIHRLPRSSTTAADVAKTWLDILEIFFPDSDGFERIDAHSTHDRVLIEVQCVKDSDGDVVVDDNDRESFLVLDCRPKSTVGCDSQFASPADGDQDDSPLSFRVICFGAQAVFLKVVASSGIYQETSPLCGVKMGSANLIKASGRDATENWLREIRDLCGAG